MTKFIITVDTNWCGTKQTYGAVAEDKEDLYDLASELAYVNFQSFGFDSQLLEDFYPDVEKYTDEMYDHICEIEGEYYNWDVEEFKGTDEEWDELEKIEI